MSFEEFERPAVAVDLVLFRMYHGLLQIALINRKEQDVENGKWSLPGAFVNIDKTLTETLYGKVADKLGFDCFSARQFAVHDNIARDDRWRVISCVYIGAVKGKQDSSDDPYFGKCTWFFTQYLEERGVLYNYNNEEVSLDELAFDHASMITEAFDRMRHDLFTEEEGFTLTGDTFTLLELRTTFEAFLNKYRYDTNFPRRMENLIEPTGEEIRGQAYRPAKVFKRKERKT